MVVAVHLVLTMEVAAIRGLVAGTLNEGMIHSTPDLIIMDHSHHLVAEVGMEGEGAYLLHLLTPRGRLIRRVHLLLTINTMVREVDMARQAEDLHHRVTEYMETGGGRRPEVVLKMVLGMVVMGLALVVLARTEVVLVVTVVTVGLILHHIHRAVHHPIHLEDVGGVGSIL